MRCENAQKPEEEQLEINSGRRPEALMSKLLIIKKGAAGDVLRTTVLLHLFSGWEVDWLVGRENLDLIRNDLIRNQISDVHALSPDKVYDLVICLEDETELLVDVFSRIKWRRIFGSYVEGTQVRYTPDSAEWFDLGRISKHGIKKANELKFVNTKSYQEILFNSLGFSFDGQRYVMPKKIADSDLRGDIAVAPRAGQTWPAKDWYYFDRLTEDLSQEYTLNILPKRNTILEHIADIKQHSFVISADSLPMHIAMGLGIPCAAFFTCTCPWEIYDYKLLTKIVSPRLKEYFYMREFSEDAARAIPYDEALRIIHETLRVHTIEAKGIHQDIMVGQIR